MLQRRLHRLTIVNLAISHSPGSRAQNQRQVVRSFPAGLLLRLPRRQQQHNAGPIQTGHLASGQACRRQVAGQLHLGCHPHPLPADIKKRHRSEPCAARAEALRVGSPSQAQRGHDAGAGNHTRGAVSERGWWAETAWFRLATPFASDTSCAVSIHPPQRALCRKPKFIG